MIFDSDLNSELNVLTQFNLKNEQDGIKIHNEAAPDMVSAVARLHEKGIVTQADGGYLTDIGRKAAEHAQDVFSILK
ncbi:MAG: TIGR02647 family protein [Cocleimonas sp.]